MGTLMECGSWIRGICLVTALLAGTAGAAGPGGGPGGGGPGPGGGGPGPGGGGPGPGGDQTREHCTFTVTLSEFKVTETQGITDRKLEIAVFQRVKEGIHEKSTSFPKGKPSIKLKEGENHSAAEIVMVEVVDKGAAVDLSVFTQVTDKDKGLNGKDEVGSETGSIAFTCAGEGSKSLTQSVQLERKSGKHKGTVQVITRASWLEVR